MLREAYARQLTQLTHFSSGKFFGNASTVSQDIQPSTTLGDLTVLERCQTDHAQALANIFRFVSSNVSGWTACGDALFVEELASKRLQQPIDCATQKCNTSVMFRNLQFPSSTPTFLSGIYPHGPKTFFDIGCNKGYTSAKFFALWAPELGLNPKSIPARRPTVACDSWWAKQEYEFWICLWVSLSLACYGFQGTTLVAWNIPKVLSVAGLLCLSIE